MNSFRETKHPLSKITQVQSHTNHFEEASVHNASLVSPQCFACRQAGFWLSSNSLAGSQGSLLAFWGNLPLHFPATFTYCPSGAQGEPVPLSIPNRRLQPKPCFSHGPSSVHHVSSADGRCLLASPAHQQLRWDELSQQTPIKSPPRNLHPLQEAAGLFSPFNPAAPVLSSSDLCDKLAFAQGG